MTPQLLVEFSSTAFICPLTRWVDASDYISVIKGLELVFANLSYEIIGTEDFEDHDAQQYSPYTLGALVRAIEDSPMILAWLKIQGRPFSKDELEEAEDAFCGAYDSMEEWASEFLCAAYGVSSDLLPFFDLEDYARYKLECGDIEAVELSDGKIYIFSAS